MPVDAPVATLLRYAGAGPVVAATTPTAADDRRRIDRRPPGRGEPEPRVTVTTPSPSRGSSRSLEPVDHTTSFEHEPTTRLPMLRADPRPPGRQAPRGQARRRRGPLFKGFPSAPVLARHRRPGRLGRWRRHHQRREPTARQRQRRPVTHAGHRPHRHQRHRPGQPTRKTDVVSRDSRPRRPGRRGRRRAAPGGGRGRRRSSATPPCAKLRRQGRGAAPRSSPRTCGRYPVAPVPPDRPLRRVRPLVELPHRPRLRRPHRHPDPRVANGIVTSAGYDGSYGNKTVVTLEDGTELWYCHQTSYRRQRRRRRSAPAS